MNLYKSLIVMTALLTLGAYSQAETKFSGFGSLVIGQTLENDEVLTADFYDVGQYENETTFKPESVFGLQVVTDIADGLKATGQLLAKGTDEFEPQLDWYYVTYRLNSEWTFMAGRRNLPMYYYSEFSEVGYAYPWVRPPSNLYWWQITQFNGLHASYNFRMAGLNNTVTAFYGNEYSTNNKEMVYYAQLYRETINGSPIVSVNEEWTDIVGFNLNTIGDEFDVRVVYFQNDRFRTRTSADGTTEEAGSTSSGISQKFYGVGGSVYFGNLTMLFDANYVEYQNDGVGTVFPTYMLSFVYNVGKYQPYIGYSKADHWRTKVDGNEKDYEEHYMATIGLRYNLSAKASAKLQFDHFEDEGATAGGWDYHGSSQTVAAALDFIF